MRWTVIQQVDGSWAVVDDLGTVIVGEQPTREDAVDRLRELATSALGELPEGGIASGRGARFRATFMEGERTSDGRVIDAGATNFNRQPPLPWMLNTETSEGHQGARLSGVVDTVSRNGNQVVLEGNFDAGSEAGQENERLVREGILTTWSPDIGDAKIQMERLDEPGSEEDEILAQLLGLGDSIMHLTCGTILGGCYSDDTELLTERGWLRFADLPPDVRVATRNPKTAAFEWQLPTQFHQYSNHRELIHFRSRKNLDLLVTPDHRMLVRSRKTGERVMSAADLADVSASGYYGIPMTSTWTVDDVTTFRIDVGEDPPESECACGCGEATPERKRWEGGGRSPGSRPKTLQGHGHGLNREPLILDGDAFAGFMGAWLAEGSVSAKHGTIQVSQAPDGRGWESYRDILTRLNGREPYHDGRQFAFHNARLARWLTQFGHAADKFVPSEIKNFSARQLRLFLDAYLLGDGSATENKAWTVSRRLADDIQEVAQKLGLWATINVRTKRRDCTMSTGRVIKAENMQPCFVITFRNATCRRENAWVFDAERVSYDGDVFCVAVPNTFLYVRRNGRPAWCGNTAVPFPALSSAKVESLAGSLVAGAFPYVRPTGTIELVESVVASGEPCEDCEADEGAELTFLAFEEQALHFGASGGSVSDVAWDGAASRFTDDQYKFASAGCDAGDEPPKSRCFLPHHEPGGAINRNGVHAAAQRVSALKGHDAASVDAAKAHLRSHYAKDLKEDAPESIGGTASASAEVVDLSARVQVDPDQEASARMAALGRLVPHAASGGLVEEFGRLLVTAQSGSLSPSDRAVLQRVLDMASDADDDVDEIQAILADMLGVPNPDEDEGAEGVEDGMAAGGVVRVMPHLVGEGRKETVVLNNNLDPKRTAAAVSRTLRASASPFRPSGEFLTDPHLDAPTPSTVEGDHIFGHLAQWGVCHTGIMDRCVLAPHSQSGYAYFQQGSVVTDSGERRRAGKLTVGCGHANLALDPDRARAHYDGGPGAYVGAHVVTGEDEFGIWFSGVVDPRLDDFQRWELETMAVSGDWRTLGGSLELIAALMVPVPGFPILASAESVDGVIADGMPRPELLMDHGTVTSLVAAGCVMPRRVALGYEVAMLRRENAQLRTDLTERLDGLESLLQTRTAPLAASAAQNLRERLRGA